MAECLSSSQLSSEQICLLVPIIFKSQDFGLVTLIPLVMYLVAHTQGLDVLVLTQVPMLVSPRCCPQCA